MLVLIKLLAAHSGNFSNFQKEKSEVLQVMFLVSVSMHACVFFSFPNSSEITVKLQ